MKAIFIIMFLVLGMGCSGQAVMPLLYTIGEEPGVYYKDTENDFDKFTGTWRYQSGNTIFEITLQKKVMYHYSTLGYYSDVLVGEYRYSDSNGIETVNTLTNLQASLEPHQYNVYGEYIKDTNLPMAQRRVELHFTDPERDYLYRDIIIKHFAAQGGTPERIEITFKGEMSAVPEGAPTELRVPEQNYTLIKVP
ncbi:hypothetical protein OGH69_03565 [Flavobacterium sp. MFBS3-15]|uniref:DUF6705 family protein n=1 Tax=Flavobacterium sp. MFBS3-15 TaxID=2989816 RepID=UPI0022363AD7|nr:DUF6705 family protein [Flavobacterium sp. MFBS3-15]MCW4468032.1 hypothetical protein [Flavobacterium sp. MFBS3-15]